MESIDAVSMSFLNGNVSSAHYPPQGKFDVALRDYKKGKYLLENRPGQLLPLASSASSISGTQIQTPKSAGNQQQHMQMQAQQKRILNKVWASVEKAMGEMRKVLVAHLQDASRSSEDHERTLEWVRYFVYHMLAHFISRTLLDLQNGGVEELVWTYFDSHHVHIMDKMSAVHRTGLRAVEGMVLLVTSFYFSLIHEPCL